LQRGMAGLYLSFMAKQTGDLFIEGTIEDLSFYKMEGAYYVRMKSSLTGKRFWRDKAFEGSRKSSSRFGEGNRIASRVYRMIKEEKRVYKLYCFLKKKAIQLLKEGRSFNEAETVLIDYLRDFGAIERTCEAKALKNKPVVIAIATRRRILCKVPMVFFLKAEKADTG
jgi:hypothetical protein